MAERKKKTADKTPTASSKRPKSPAGGKAVHPTLSEHGSLFAAAESFIRENCGFESSVPIDAAVADVGMSHDLNEAFSVPLRRQLFSMGDALNWVMFLMVAPEVAAAEDDRELFSEWAPFDAVAALRLVKDVYDLGIDEVVHQHFEVDDDDDDDDDDAGDDGAGGEAGPC